MGVIFLKYNMFFHHKIGANACQVCMCQERKHQDLLWTWIPAITEWNEIICSVGEETNICRSGTKMNAKHTVYAKTHSRAAAPSTEFKLVKTFQRKTLLQFLYNQQQIFFEGVWFITVIFPFFFFFFEVVKAISRRTVGVRRYSLLWPGAGTLSIFLLPEVTWLTCDFWLSYQ